MTYINNFLGKYIIYQAKNSLLLLLFVEEVTIIVE